MKFGPVPVDEALGALSAHALRMVEGTIRKGQRLCADDIAMARRCGVERIVVARLEPGDVHEDDAAARLAAALAGAAVRADQAFTGRVNLYAQADGLVRVAADRLTRLNRVDEAITVASLPDFTRVERGRMVATVKIIPYAVPARALGDACAVLAGGGAGIFIAPFKALRVGLIVTRVAGTTQKILDKTRRVTADRLAALGCLLEAQNECAHSADEIADALRGQAAAGLDLIIVFGASATIDRRDMVPMGIETAGGAIDHFGMPVDPGNLLLLAHIGDVPVLGAPGCARSPKENGFDWVLHRLAAGMAVTRDDITAMGAGGLLMEIDTRPAPRRARQAAARKPRIAAIVLAAGKSSRMGGPNKLLQELDGEALVRHAAKAALAGGAAPVVAVTGHMADEVGQALAGLDVATAHNSEFALGLSTSLRRGLDALPADVDGALIVLGDMPRVSASLVARLIAAFDPADAGCIVVPQSNAKRGNPVLFARRHFAALRAVEGDVGARHIIAAHEDAVTQIDADNGVLIDVDTPAALAALKT